MKEWCYMNTKGLNFYVWDNGDVVSPDEAIRLAGEHQCFVTGDMIREDEDAHWTDEFDAWISIRGYQMIQNAQSTGELANNREWEIIYGEWYAKDESISGRQEMMQELYDPDNPYGN
tara:strand:+ start:139 stop:489 length:351 start_codon:yes stop_codon:yes gene_type:complete